MVAPAVITDLRSSCDVLVVGSGPVGTAAAVEVVRRHPSAKVLIVEVGPTLTERPGVNLKNLADETDRLELQTRSQGPESHPYGVSSLQDRSRGRAGSADALARPGTFLLSADVEPGRERDADEAVQMRAASMSANVGGMGVHWTCASPWPYGTERTSVLPSSDLDELLDEARQLLRVTHNAYAPNSVGDAVLRGLRTAYPRRAR